MAISLDQHHHLDVNWVAERMQQALTQQNVPSWFLGAYDPLNETMPSPKSGVAMAFVAKPTEHQILPEAAAHIPWNFQTMAEMIKNDGAVQQHVAAGKSLKFYVWQKYHVAEQQLIVNFGYSLDE